MFSNMSIDSINFTNIQLSFALTSFLYCLSVKRSSGYTALYVCMYISLSKSHERKISCTFKASQLVALYFRSTYLLFNHFASVPNGTECLLTADSDSIHFCAYKSL